MNSSGVIQLLSDQVSNQIAAGEVVQRPSSVVKELVENAVDAEATQVRVVIKDSGKTLIQVVDDGKGMSEVDAQLCFERHATSKIRKAEDLFNITTKGFRGEALASIASVAQVELITKREEDEKGVRIEIDGGKLLANESVEAAKGSVFSVRNLFFNIPARRYFLKTDAIEFRHIIDEFERVALTHPDVHFVLTHNGNVVFDLPKSNLKQRLVHVFGGKYNDQLIQLDEDTEIVRISGFVGRPEIAKRTRGDQYFFVNQRFIKSPFLNHAVQQAYDQILPSGSFPFYLIALDVPPSSIDINIHPTKTEIKFQDERSIHALLHAAVRRGLGKNQVAPSLDFEQENIPLTQASPGSVRIPQVDVDHDFNPFQKSDSWQQKSRNWMEQFAQAGYGFEKEIEVQQEQLGFDSGDWEGGAPFQIGRVIVGCEINSELKMFHQTRLHWQVLFEEHSNQNSHSFVAQQLLFPIQLHVQPKDISLLQDHDVLLASFGVELNLEGEPEIIAAPESLDEQAALNFIELVLESLRMGIEGPDLRMNLLKDYTRRLSVRKGQMLTVPEMLDMLVRWNACENKNFAPDGKSIALTFGIDYLEDQLGK